MTKKIEVKVPDIGGHDDVPVIELLVAVGDTVSAGSVIAVLEAEGAGAAPLPHAAEVDARSAAGEGGEKK